ncbi:MAG: hypothetical protein F4018_04320 [Acidobacteria bacterium]|nr:hypothetical protein [Acidobacteriota bacterium]
MSAVPRWSHRDPVEGSNPFPVGDARRDRWDEATADALAALRRYDDGIAASVSTNLTSESYVRRWLDLATMRFDTWCRRGLAVVDGTAAQRGYAAWLETYVANWRAYVAETCPHVAPNIRRELDARLSACAVNWTGEACRLVSSTRGEPAADARPGPHL